MQPASPMHMINSLRPTWSSSPARYSHSQQTAYSHWQPLPWMSINSVRIAGCTANHVLILKDNSIAVAWALWRQGRSTGEDLEEAARIYYSRVKCPRDHSMSFRRSTESTVEQIFSMQLMLDRYEALSCLIEMTGTLSTLCFHGLLTADWCMHDCLGLDCVT